MIWSEDHQVKGRRTRDLKWSFHDKVSDEPEEKWVKVWRKTMEVQNIEFLLTFLILSDVDLRLTSWGTRSTDDLRQSASHMRVSSAGRFMSSCSAWCSGSHFCTDALRAPIHLRKESESSTAEHVRNILGLEVRIKHWKHLDWIRKTEHEPRVVRRKLSRWTVSFRSKENSNESLTRSSWLELYSNTDENHLLTVCSRLDSQRRSRKSWTPQTEASARWWTSWIRASALAPSIPEGRWHLKRPEEEEGTTVCHLRIINQNMITCQIPSALQSEKRSYWYRVLEWLWCRCTGRGSRPSGCSSAAATRPCSCPVCAADRDTRDSSRPAGADWSCVWWRPPTRGSTKAGQPGD